MEAGEAGQEVIATEEEVGEEEVAVTAAEEEVVEEEVEMVVEGVGQEATVVVEGGGEGAVAGKVVAEAEVAETEREKRSNITYLHNKNILYYLITGLLILTSLTQYSARDERLHSLILIERIQHILTQSNFEIRELISCSFK